MPATLGRHNALSAYRRYLQNIQERPLLQASLFLILSLLLLILLVSTALRPTLITIFNLLGSIQQQHTIDQQMTQKIQQLTTAQQQLTVIQPRLAVLETALAPISQFRQWTQAVERLATTNLVVISKVDVNADGTFSMAASGSYPDLYRFLNSLEQLQRVSVVKSLQITKSTSGPLQLILGGQLPGYAQKRP